MPEVVRSRNITAHSEPQLRTGMLHPAVQSDIYWYHQVQGITVNMSPLSLEYRQRGECAKACRKLKSRSFIEEALWAQNSCKILATQKESFRTDEMERNRDNITLGFLLFLEREHAFLIQIIELATL